MNASLYLAEVGLADEACPDAIPEAAGGEWGHGVAKPKGVIHSTLCDGFVLGTEITSLIALFPSQLPHLAMGRAGFLRKPGQAQACAALRKRKRRRNIILRMMRDPARLQHP
jgi:hypothetical protein